MKKSLAQLGHGKWKSALGHTLLLIGMVLFSMGVYAQTPTGGLYMNKSWTPDPSDPTGAKGTIRLETFVTGEKIITESHVPTDIVVVVDQSGSMSESFGNTTKILALQSALRTFVETIQADAEEYGVDHRIAIVGFATAPVTGSTNQYNNTELLTPSEKSYDQLGESDYTAALVNADVNGDVNTILYDAINNIDANGGTVMDYGLRMAKNVLLYRSPATFDPGNGDTQPRNQVVVFFTDGYAGLQLPAKGQNYVNEMFAQYRNTNNSISLVCSQTVADNSVTEAKALKQNGAVVYSIGIFDGASPTTDYQTQLKYYSQSGPITDHGQYYYYYDYDYRYERQYYLAGSTRRVAAGRNRTNQSWTTQNAYDFMYWEPATAPTSGSGDAAANGLMHFISSNYAADEIESVSGTPWASMTIMAHPAGDHNNGKYLVASNASELASIFENIAAENGSSAIPMGAGTVVQDVIAPSFRLNIPEGATAGTTIKAYAPLCNGKSGNMFTFEPETDGATRLQIGDKVIQGETVHGVVIGGDENRLADNVVQYDEGSKTLTFNNFNFEAMFVAQEVDAQGNPLFDNEGNPICTGRKLVMLIPLEIADGSWGDGINTNGPLSVIKPDGTTVETDWLPFNNPTANVLGSVWTEVIVQKPEGFDANNIDSPEDLAWFISEVNGRIGYNLKNGYNSNNVASHPQLNGRLTADIDMSAHNWVPIGCGWQVELGDDGLTQFKMENGEKVHMVYEGTFDGNGHVITGLKNNASKYYKQITQNQAGVVVFPGMFSDVKGTVKNVFVLDADFRGKHHDAHFVHHGIIADTLSQGGNIFNCEAAGRITCNNDDPTNDQLLIYGGLVGLNEGTIHSCMAMAELTAYTMGGMIGENRSTFYNGFTNGVYNYLDNGVTGKYAGGIAATSTSTGSIDNCYVRFQRANQNLDKVTFGQITGSGSFTNAYSPADLANMVPANSTAGTDTYTNALPAQWLNRNGQDNLLSSGASMLETLENGKGEGASWKRTTALGYEYSLQGGNINKDLPVLKFNEFTCLGSADGIRIDYSTTMKEMLHRHNTGNMNENTNINNEFTASNADYYKVTAHPTINAGAIDLYANDALTASSKAEDATYFSNDEDVVVYIDENVSLLQDANSTITGFTGQTLKNFASDNGERWHNISSSLSNSMFGWTYTGAPAVGEPHTNGESIQHAHSWETNPCGMRFNQSDDDTEIFPADFINYHHGDFYCFYEEQYHWINFRRHTNCHWHMDDYDEQIIYTNEDHFIPGKGYLMAINADQTNVNRSEQFIQNRGTLNNGDIDIDVTAKAPEWTELTGYNLLGNPYQSFLDFDAFVTGNQSLWGSGDEFSQTYAVYDPTTDKYVQYKKNSSKGSRAASQYINMHQGFFIQTSKSETQAHFTNNMRTNDATPNFRSEQPAYPLINFIVTDSEGKTDLAILEVNRDENDGAKKLRMGSASGRIFFKYNDEKLAIFFRDNAEGSQSLHFSAEENGNFTLNWERANDNFSSLTLVDNITGVKTDMLTHDHYTFEGRTDDYTSRFKIVFGTINNEEEEEDTTVENFAFFNNGSLIVNGEGRLDVIDVLGRVVYTAELTDTQNTVNLPYNAKGVCMLRLSNGDNVKVQKMFVK